MKPDLKQIRPFFFKESFQKRFCIVCHEQIRSTVKEYCSGKCMIEAGVIKPAKV